MNQPVSEDLLEAAAKLRSRLRFNMLLLVMNIVLIPFCFTKGHIILDKFSAKPMDRYVTEFERQLEELKAIDIVTKNEQRLKDVGEQNTLMLLSIVKNFPKLFDFVAALVFAFSAIQIFHNSFEKYRFLKLIDKIKESGFATQ